MRRNLDVLDFVIVEEDDMDLSSGTYLIRSLAQNEGEAVGRQVYDDGTSLPKRIVPRSISDGDSLGWDDFGSGPSMSWRAEQMPSGWFKLRTLDALAGEVAGCIYAHPIIGGSASDSDSYSYNAYNGRDDASKCRAGEWAIRRREGYGGGVFTIENRGGKGWVFREGSGRTGAQVVCEPLEKYTTDSGKLEDAALWVITPVDEWWSEDET